MIPSATLYNEWYVDPYQLQALAAFRDQSTEL
jgi:hypothetical protein